MKEAASTIVSSDEKDGARRAIQIYNTIHRWTKAYKVMSECRVPVIVGVHGACIGAGLDLLSFTDIRHCTKDATFAIK